MASLFALLMLAMVVVVFGDVFLFHWRNGQKGRESSLMFAVGVGFSAGAGWAYLLQGG